MSQLSQYLSYVKHNAQAEKLATHENNYNEHILLKDQTLTTDNELISEKSVTYKRKRATIYFRGLIMWYFPAITDISIWKLVRCFTQRCYVVSIHTETFSWSK